MEWIKRNLLFVISGVVGVLLIGAAGYFLYLKIDENERINTELAGQIAELERLYKQDPHPGTETLDNIGAMKREEERVQSLLNQAKSLFIPIPPFQRTDDIGFKSVLEMTIAYLQQRATNAGISLPGGGVRGTGPYYFTFGTLRYPLQYPDGDIDGWLMQLSEMKSMCDVLFAAKINALEGIRRLPLAPKYDVLTVGQDFLQGVPAIYNGTYRLTPYEITFRGFSSEVAEALRGFTSPTNSFIVKMINVERSNYNPPPPPTPAPASASSRGGPVMPQAATRPRLSVEEERYGAGYANSSSKPSNPYAPRVAVIATQTNAGPVTLLAEKPLRVTMLVEVVKLTTAPNPAAKASQ